MPLTVHASAKINLTWMCSTNAQMDTNSLASVVQTISLRDTLELMPVAGSEINLICEGEHAAGCSGRLLQSRGQSRTSRPRCGALRCGSGLRLQKGIPSQAGLGGGSSDAAAAPIVVTGLFGLDLGPRLLHDLGGQTRLGCAILSQLLVPYTFAAFYIITSLYHDNVPSSFPHLLLLYLGFSNYLYIGAADISPVAMLRSLFVSVKPGRRGVSDRVGIRRG